MRLEEQNQVMGNTSDDLRGYLVKHYYAAGDRRLCQSKEYFTSTSLSAALVLAQAYARDLLDPSYAEKDEAGVYVIEIFEWYGSDDEGFDLVGEEVEKIRYKIEHIAKVTEL